MVLLRKVALPIAICLTAVLLACGDDDLGAPSGTPAPDRITGATPTTTPSRTASASPAPNTTSPSSTAPASTEPPVASGDSEVLVGAGDIANCDSDGDEAVAVMLESIDGAIFTAGDNAYPDGSSGDFTSCYDPSWGRLKSRTRPVPGNHDYVTSGALAYFDYFGEAAGERGKGYYSYNVGAWHVIALNSNCSAIGGCGERSPQQSWLVADLAAHPAACTIAYWHHPVLTIGPHEDDEAGMLPIWQTLYDGGTDLVVSGHEHNYQRYAPLNRDADGTDVSGIRLIVSGTGGSNLTNADTDRANSKPGLEVWADSPGDGDGHDASFGVIKFSLSERSYEWEFVPVRDGGFTDFGSATCH